MPAKCISKPEHWISRKQRTHFTDEQIQILEHTYKKHQYVTGNDRDKLAMLLNLPVPAVKNWFKNKRSHLRRINVEVSKYSKYMKQSNSKNSNVMKRCFFTREQKKVLENVFQKQKVIEGEATRELAMLLGVSEKKVSDWFKYKCKRLEKLGDKEALVRQNESSILLPEQASYVDDYELPVDDYIINDKTLTTDYDEESINFPQLPTENLLPEVQPSPDASPIHQDLAQIDTVNSSWQPKVGAEVCSIEKECYTQENFTKGEFYSVQENTCDSDYFSVFRMLNPGYCWGE